MNKVINRLKSLFYYLPFGLKAADSEIMGANSTGEANDTVIQQQVNDKRVAKHLLKGEITQEVEELRYRTYKVDKESNKYNYVGHGVAVKKDEKKQNNIIKFSQENKLVCNDILTELKHVNDYGVERYTVNIDYMSPVRIKLQEFLTLVDVVIKDGEKAVTTLHFSDVRNPQVFKSKPFVAELEKLETLFNNNDTYGLSRNDYATSVLCMNFTTFKATDGQPDVVNYNFTNPELIGVHHENGEFKLLYQWDSYNRIDLTEKFFNAELEEKYKKKEKKNQSSEQMIEDEVKFTFKESVKPEEGFWNSHNRIIKCSKCGKDIDTFMDGFINDEKTGKPICVECYKKYLLDLTK